VNKPGGKNRRQLVLIVEREKPETKKTTGFRESPNIAQPSLTVCKHQWVKVCWEERRKRTSLANERPGEGQVEKVRRIG